MINPSSIKSLANIVVGQSVITFCFSFATFYWKQGSRKVLSISLGLVSRFFLPGKGPGKSSSQVWCLTHDCHACGSKTLISCLFTPVFQLLMSVKNVWATTALTKINKLPNIKKLEQMRKEISPCEWSTFSEFSYYSS